MDFAQSRFNMVEGQIKTNRVTDPRVIDVMSELPRENFVPSTKKSLAYIDDALEVAPARFLLEPMVHARMLEAAMIQKDDIVLDVGCATGYSAAVLSKIASTVVALESDEALAKTASDNLSEVGSDNCVVIKGPLKEGVAKQAPFDVILINGAVEEIPQSLIDQLAERGRMVAITQTGSAMASVSIYSKLAGNLSKRDLMEAGVAPLPGFEKEKGFVF